jgi:hypothetical protein
VATKKSLVAQGKTEKKSEQAQKILKAKKKSI